MNIYYVLFNTYIMSIIIFLFYLLLMFCLTLNFFSIPHLFKHLIFLCKTYERYETNNCFS